MLALCLGVELESRCLFVRSCVHSLYTGLFLSLDRFSRVDGGIVVCVIQAVDSVETVTFPPGMAYTTVCYSITTNEICTLFDSSDRDDDIEGAFEQCIIYSNISLCRSNTVKDNESQPKHQKRVTRTTASAKWIMMDYLKNQTANESSDTAG